jgi:NCS1 family nucleobase:cation symporter-1
VFFDRTHRPWKALAAMLAGIVSSFPFWNQSLFVGVVPANHPAFGDISFVVGGTVTAAVYLALRPLRGPPDGAGG